MSLSCASGKIVCIVSFTVCFSETSCKVSSKSMLSILDMAMISFTRCSISSVAFSASGRYFS